MDRVSIELRVFYEQGRWIAVFEQRQAQRLCAYRLFFDHEPKDYEVYAYILNHTLNFQNQVFVPFIEKQRSKNPKRRIREAAIAMKQHGISTKSQQVLQEALQQSKQDQKKRKRERQLQEKEAAFQRKQRKRKAKHRGR